MSKNAKYRQGMVRPNTLGSYMVSKKFHNPTNFASQRKTEYTEKKKSRSVAEHTIRQSAKKFGGYRDMTFDVSRDVYVISFMDGSRLTMTEEEVEDAGRTWKDLALQARVAQQSQRELKRRQNQWLDNEVRQLYEDLRSVVWTDNMLDRMWDIIHGVYLRGYEDASEVYEKFGEDDETEDFPHKLRKIRTNEIPF